MNQTMLAATFKGNGIISLEQRPVPSLQSENDVLLECGGVGICGSDLQITDIPPRHPAKIGVILGHEFSGKVVEVGKNVKGIKIDDNVAVDPNAGCGRCWMCRNGYFNACLEVFNNPQAPEQGWPNTPGQWWDGGMARYIRVPEKHLYRISKNVPLWQVATFEPLAVVLNGINKISPKIGETACVFGSGPIGLFAIALLKAFSASCIIVSEPSEERRKLALEIGANIAIDPTKDNINEVVKQHTKGLGTNIAIDAVGQLLPAALEVIAFAGRVLQIGIPSSNITFRPFHIFEKEAIIYGSFLMGKMQNETVRILENGLLPLDKIITHRFSLDCVDKAFKLARNGKAGKVIIEP